ncbi:hypothetical protein, partial [Kaarinaea lacus]
MISGATRKWSQRQTWALAVLIVLSMGYSISTAFGANNTRNDKSENISLSTLMEARKSVEQSTTRFREEKIIQALNEEVILEGELVYRSPDYLAKKYSVPEKISYEITDNTVTVTDT